MLSKDAEFFVKFLFSSSRSNRPEVFLGTGVMKICSKFTGEHPCGSAISITLLCNFIETALQTMFTSYRIGFCSISQNYTVWCEYFAFNIYVEYELKNFEQYFNLFWWEKTHLKKKENRRMSKVLKIDFVLSGDEIQFLHSLANSNFGCYCSRSALLISPFESSVNAPTALYEFIKIITT